VVREARHGGMLTPRYIANKICQGSISKMSLQTTNAAHIGEPVEILK